MLRDRIRPSGAPATVMLLLMMLLQLLCFNPVHAEESGTVIPSESRPCVDCHAFEFMQRALQDLKKTAFNLDSRGGHRHPTEEPCFHVLSSNFSK
ncbi:neuropeptide-like protein C4orf48 homolog isoform X2 [Carassius gibelio]|uniref:neuropeptide-like protein C4orf48 homolog isoform X2 n=1 Tax=Carassius gibelio TaxID=101364 RepID=UPI002279B371|nr:neuropeptide-like protein C4orf48 homolog isoform X2 [Carassius gibelio]